MKKFISTENTTLKYFTDNNFPQGSFYLNRLLKEKEVKVNGQKVSTNVDLFVGDEIIYFTNFKMESRKIFDIVYEDENVLICDKESGVNSEGLFAYLKDIYGEGNIYFIHRLDRNTQGLILFAKNKESEQDALNCFKTSNFKKEYEALCYGKFEKEHEILNAYLLKNSETSFVKISPQKVEGSERIITEYSLIKQYDDYALVNIKLHTGKTHQIRAHMAYINHAVIGDEKYGNSRVNDKYNLKRQCLLAKRIQILSKGKLEYLSPIIFTSKKNLTINSNN